MPATLVVGFIVDYFTFTNIQIETTLLVLGCYWLAVFCIIIFVHLYDSERVSEKLRYVRLAAPLLIQFFFGGLLGGSFIFYWFSGALSVSWPLITLFVILMVSNDQFRHYLDHPLVQMGAYSFITLSLASVALPFLFNSLNPGLFILAGIGSLAVASVLGSVIIRIKRYETSQRLLLFMPVIGVLALMNLFYFSNVIPPIPLSIREAGAFHSVARSGSGYVLSGEPESWLQKIFPGQTLHLKGGDRAYVYSAIFAPAELHAVIVHKWEYFNEEEGEWVEKDKLSFSMTGGRKLGYRGYSWKSHVAAGKWRVSVETLRGQVLGRVRFNVEQVEELPELVEIAR